MKLTREQYIRYSRQMILPEIGWEGQQKLLEARVLLVGLGGLGSPQALYLGAMGVGTLGLVDGDRVDLTNLHRQVLHTTLDVGAAKVDSAEETIRALNPDVQVRKHQTLLGAGNAMEILSSYDVVVDCTDNFPARYLLNDACALLAKPLVHGAIYRFEGQATVFYPSRGGPCYRCLFPVPPAPGSVPSCAEAGVLGLLPGVVGLLQAGEVVKLILGQGKSLMGRLLFCDMMGARFQELPIQKDPKCALCGENPTIRTLADYQVSCGAEEVCSGDVTGRRPEPTAGGSAGTSETGISVIDLEERFRTGGKGLMVLDVREPWERSVYPFDEGLKLPYSQLHAQWESLLPYKDKELVVCCLFGWRSREAIRMLQERGFQRLKNLEGGLEEWFLLKEQTEGRGEETD